MLNRPTVLLVVALLSVMLLSACGGGGTGDSSSAGAGGVTRPNNPPVLTATPTTLNLESEASAQIAIAASDDDGTPLLSLSNLSANLSAQLSADGKVLTVTARSVNTVEKGTVTVTATEPGTGQKQTTQLIDVNVFPKINLFALVNGSRQQGTLTVEYARPLSFRVVDENNADIPFSAVAAKDPTLVRVQSDASTVVLTALKAGMTTLTITGTAASGLRYTKTFDLKTTGNQQPTIRLSPESITLQETTTAQLTVNISDPDGSAIVQGALSVASADPTVASAIHKDGQILLNGLKTGTTTVTVTLQDGEFTVSATASVTVIAEALPVISVNQNMLIELEETDTIAVPIEIVGPKSADYKPSVRIDSVNGKLSDLSYSVVGNTLNITAAELKDIGAAGLVSYKVTATATNGKHTLTSPTIGLDVLIKTNGWPIFEFANKFGPNVMIKRDGTVTVPITVNDDNPEKVVIFNPEASFNNSKAGTYTVTYDDVNRQLTFQLNGFERNERFGILLSYRDGQVGGKFSIAFRTTELTEQDLEVLEMRKTAIAQIEATRAYQWVARLYAEHLENSGVVDAQYVDDLIDQIQHDDTLYFRFNTTEAHIMNYLEQVYSNDVNTGTLPISAVRAGFENLIRDAQELNRSAMTRINEMADQSNGRFPRLNFETSISQVAPLQFSKFYGKAAYGSIQNGKWEYAPNFRFLAAIDAKVAENTAKRLQ